MINKILGPIKKNERLQKKDGTTVFLNTVPSFFENFNNKVNHKGIDNKPNTQ